MKHTPKLFGREPALWLAAVAAAVQMGSALGLDLTTEVQGAVNAAAVAVIGFLTAAMVSMEKAVPAALGLLQAVLALAVSLGLALDPETQSTIMAASVAVASLVTRSQVTVPTPPDPSQLDVDDPMPVEMDHEHAPEGSE